jgi:hypothetical protein
MARLSFSLTFPPLKLEKKSFEGEPEEISYYILQGTTLLTILAGGTPLGSLVVGGSLYHRTPSTGPYQA